MKNDERNQKVKYHDHGILKRSRVLEDGKENWYFESEKYECQFIGTESIIDNFNELSGEGYELVCYSPDEMGYIFKSNKKYENTWEYIPDRNEENTDK